MAVEAQRFFAPQAWVRGSWASDVTLTVERGLWSGVQCGSDPAQRHGATVLAGPVLPGLVNAHSHAFQRAIAGLAERSDGAAEDFWSWRERMYAAANRITPGQMEAVATFLYGELLRAGFTQVCEFHYLHNDIDGRAYADPLEMSLALVRAAQAAGIGLTLLPTLYMRAGFAARGLREDQRRFASTPESVLRIAQEVRRQAGEGGLVTAGVAVHSLRAVDETALNEVAAAASQQGIPVHIHIAEQQQEVDDCIERHGLRPIEWLLAKAPVDASWNLVHATHTTPDELRGVRERGAAIVICPTTEANLGDGVFNLPGWMGQTGGWSIGSDSNVTRSWQEELRLLEYSQRLTLGQRNVAARAALSQSSAAALFEGALAGGPAASGVALGGIAVGQRADFMVVDAGSSALQGLPADHVLDAMVFSSPGAGIAQVHVAGCKRQGRLEATGFAAAMRSLWAGGC